MSQRVRVLFLVPYPASEAPSQRFRFEQYLDGLTYHGIYWEMESFLSLKAWSSLFVPGSRWRTVVPVLCGYLKRLKILFHVEHFDFVFIHREAAPLGPPFFEWYIARILRKKIIYDFDDAIWLPDRARESPFIRQLKWRGKIASICRWSHTVSVGNAYLFSYARRFSARVVLNPTTIETENLHNPAFFTQPENTRITIGWTGSHSTLKYLFLIEPVLQAVAAEFPHVDFLCIADQKPTLTLERLRFVPWSKATEVRELMNIHIGIMPLPDDAWSQGKCGFKALQYMALEKATVASPVGVNTSIIEHGKNGFLATSPTEWHYCLQQLIQNTPLRLNMGVLARQTVQQRFSVASNRRNFSELFLI